MPKRWVYTKKINKRSARDYVCPVCFRSPKNCKCGHYSMSLILVDYKLQEAIQKLNDAHLWTVDCCEGHFTDEIPNTYISFVNSIRFSDVPKGFILENKGTVIRYIYRNRKSREGFKKEQAEVMKNLYSWVDQKIKSR